MSESQTPDSDVRKSNPEVLEPDSQVRKSDNDGTKVRQRSEKETPERNPRKKKEKEEPDFSKTPTGKERTVHMRFHREKGTPHIIVPDEIDQAGIEAIITQTETHPGPLEVAARTAEARAEAGGNYAVPGDDVLADAAIACLWGDGPRKGSGTYRDMVNVLSQVHADWGLHDMAVGEALDMVREATRLFKKEKPDMAVYKYPSFAANYGNYLSQAKPRPNKRAKPPPDDYEPVYGGDPEPVKQESGGDPIWEQAKKELALQADKYTFETWIANTVGLGRETLTP